MFGQWENLGDTLTPAQIAQVAADAGCSPDQIPIAVAVAMGESSGITTAQNPNLAREHSIGLWQINIKGNPQFASWDLTDPATNARAMMALGGCSNGNWRPWGAFTNGSYQKYLPQGQAAAGGVSTTDTGGDTGDSSDPLGLGLSATALALLAVALFFLMR